MKPLADFPIEELAALNGIFCDLDETVTIEGRLPSASLAAMERAQEAGLIVVLVTGRPAGWCDHMARMWPVNAVVGEGGAFFFRYERDKKRMIRRYVLTREERRDNWKRFELVLAELMREVPNARVASDQAYRETDLAIDYAEDMDRLTDQEVDAIQAVMQRHGMNAVRSTAHVNSWFGDYDKLSVTKLMMKDFFAADLDEMDVRSQYTFIGDSPNDQPMFRFFENAIGVANVRYFEEQLNAWPCYVTNNQAGVGFVEVVDCILAARQS